MAPVRPRATDVHATLERLFARDVSLASGPNGILSKAEQAAAAPHVASAAEAVRTKGARVKDAALEAPLSSRASALIASVNQPSGVGRAFFSAAEARAARAADPELGAHVERAYAIASGRAVDGDGIAEARVRAAMPAGERLARFASEDAATNFKAPAGRSVTWLVKTGEDTYAWGRNDLWAERFQVDAQTGAVTVTGEH